MNLKEFYKTYNLNKTEFSYIAGVGATTLVKYDKGETIRNDSKMRIETAVHVAEKYNLVRPTFDHGKALGLFGLSYRNEFQKKVNEYKASFKKLIEEES